MLKTRLLPPDEWDKLMGTELELLIPVMVPEKTRVIVAENESGSVVGCWGLFQFTHAEGLWIAPEHRKASSVFRRLIQRARQELREMGERAVWTGSMSDDVTTMIEHAGAVRLPGVHYALPAGERHVT